MMRNICALYIPWCKHVDTDDEEQRARDEVLEQRWREKEKKREEEKLSQRRSELRQAVSRLATRNTAPALRR